MPAGNLAAALEYLHDPVVGIVGRLHERPREPGAPDYVHFAARTCNPAAFGGAAGLFWSGAAGPTREGAVASALRGAVARYCAALYDRGGLPLATFADADFPCLKPQEFALYGTEQYRRPGFAYVPFAEDMPVRWASAIDLASGETVHVPAGLVWFPFSYLRSAGDMPIVASAPAGIACGDDVAAAALAGIYEVVARDAAALFWQTVTSPPRLQSDTLPVTLRDLVRRFEVTGDRVMLLDVTTNSRIPSYVAVVASDRPGAPAFALAAAANLDAPTAVANALTELAETHRLARDAQQRRPPPGAANDWEDVIDSADHLNFAADRENSERVAFMLAADDRRHLADQESAATGSVAGDLEICIGRVMNSGSHVLAANLTSEDVSRLGLAVCRVVIPGYLPLVAGHGLRALGGNRVYEVPQKMGYRGIPRGSAGNPSPHPFR